MIPPGLILFSTCLKHTGRTCVHSSLPSTTMTSNAPSGMAFKYSEPSKPTGFLKSNGASLSVAFSIPFSCSRRETHSNHFGLSSIENTDLVRHAKNNVEPPEPYSHTVIYGLKNPSRK